jgi:hypothetical protein
MPLRTERNVTKEVRTFTDNYEHTMTAAYQELKFAMQFKRVNEGLLGHLHQ